MKNTKILNINKPAGLTLGQTISQVRYQFPKLKNKKIGYAGRLDPLAEGVLLLLIDEENKKATYYQKLDKTYQFQILFGIKTDTYDILGLPKALKKIPTLKQIQQHLTSVIPSFFGKQTQPYPPYSSARVEGKPLFYWARKDKLDQLNIPTKTVTIKNIRLNNIYSISTTNLLKVAEQKISSVSGDFRQEQILSAWKTLLVATKQNSWPIAQLNISCSSGTYVRSIAHKLGKKIGSGALSLKIKRTSVGKHTLTDSDSIQMHPSSFHL